MSQIESVCLVYIVEFLDHIWDKLPKLKERSE